MLKRLVPSGPDHALAFGDMAVSLLRRETDGTWTRLDHVAATEGDLDAAMTALRQTIPRAGAVHLFLESAHVLSMPLPEGTDAAAALAASSGRPAERLAIATAHDPATGERTALAAERVTCEEAVGHARRWGFRPVSLGTHPALLPGGTVVLPATLPKAPRDMPRIAAGALLTLIAGAALTLGALNLSTPEPSDRADPPPAMAALAPAAPITAAALPDAPPLPPARPAAPEPVVAAPVDPAALPDPQPASALDSPEAERIAAPLAVPVLTRQPAMPSREHLRHASLRLPDLGPLGADRQDALSPPMRPRAPVLTGLPAVTATAIALPEDAIRIAQADAPEAPPLVIAAATGPVSAAPTARPATLAIPVRPTPVEGPTTAAPVARPAAVARRVAAARAAAAAPPRTAIANDAAVARTATVTARLDDGGPGLLGIFTSRNNREALLRLEDGTVTRVRAGHQVGGWTVGAIGPDSVRLTGRGGPRTLQLAFR